MTSCASIVERYRDHVLWFRLQLRMVRQCRRLLAQNDEKRCRSHISFQRKADSLCSTIVFVGLTLCRSRGPRFRPGLNVPWKPRRVLKGR
jgi:hypothetical protein